jgi:two-component system sensor histidine kinase KdpD
LERKETDPLELSATRRYSQPMQYLISIGMVILISAVCFLFARMIGYRVVALILLMTVSIIAMLFDILPVLTAALLSALVWNILFIPPLYTFHIATAEDLLMFILYFVIALVNAVLTFNIRAAEKKARDKEGREKTIRLYNTLLNSLSHEFRTPVSTIIGAVDTLQENKNRLTEENQEELLQQIDSASLRLNRQVENLLNMSRLESGMLQLHLDWCDLNELIFSVIQKLPPVIPTHTIVFKPHEQLPLFRLDAGMMEQVLHNIIYNATQYTPAHTTIEIEADPQAEELVIQIRDNGKGFPEQEIPFVFDKFYRVPHTQTGGSGLGLSIAKGFTEAHNGTITLGNQKEGGALFIIRIPAETSFINNLKNE